MEENKSLNEQKEQVILIPDPRQIIINNACANRAYGLFDSETGTQVGEFKKGTEGKVEFIGLDPSRHYDIGAIEGMGDEKPYFAIAWNYGMKDTTDEILKNSGNLPVIYPATYTIKDNSNNSNNIFDLVDDNGDKVGEVAKLAPTGDKLQINFICSFKMKDDTQK